MPQPPDFQEFCTDFRRMRSFMDEVQQTATMTPGERQCLADLAAEMDKQFAELQKAYPEAMAAIDKQVEETQKIIDRTQADIAQTRARLDEMMQAQAAPPPAPEKPAVPPEPIDPELGQKLRHELLERLGLHPPGKQPGRTFGDVWDSRDTIS